MSKCLPRFFIFFLNSRTNHCTNTEKKKKKEKTESLALLVVLFRNWKVTAPFWRQRLRAENVLCDVTVCLWTYRWRLEEGIACLWPKHGLTLRKTALIYFEAPGTLHQTTRRCVPENFNLKLHRCEHSNLAWSIFPLERILQKLRHFAFTKRKLISMLSKASQWTRTYTT